MSAQTHGAGSVTERLLLSSDGQMVVVFRAQLVKFGRWDHQQVLPRSSLGTDPPLEGTAGLAHSLAGKVVTRIMLETQHTVLLHNFFFLVVSDLDYISLLERRGGKEGRKERGEESVGQAH